MSVEDDFEELLDRRIAYLEAALERIGDPTEMSGDGDPEGFPPSPAMREMWCRINRARTTLDKEPIKPVQT